MLSFKNRVLLMRWLFGHMVFRALQIGAPVQVLATYAQGGGVNQRLSRWRILKDTGNVNGFRV